MSKVTGKLIPLRNNILVTDMNFGERTSAGGVVLLSDDGKSEGVRHRWGRVWAIGPEQTDVKIGDWLLIEHGRWTRGVTVVEETGEEIIIRRIDPNGILVVTDENPGDNTYGVHSKVTHQTFDFAGGPGFEQ